MHLEIPTYKYEDGKEYNRDASSSTESSPAMATLHLSEKEGSTSASHRHHCHFKVTQGHNLFWHQWFSRKGWKITGYFYTASKQTLATFPTGATSSQNNHFSCFFSQGRFHWLFYSQ